MKEKVGGKGRGEGLGKYQQKIRGEKKEEKREGLSNMLVVKVRAELEKTGNCVIGLGGCQS